MVDIDISKLPGAIPANTGSITDVSQLGSFGRGVTSMLPGGNAAYSAIAGAIQNEPVKQENQELGNEQEQDTEENPISSLAGKVVGIAAPAVLTGGASAPESLGEAALQGAGVGGLYGAGNAATTLENGGSGAQVLSDVTTGVATGAVGGAGVEALGSAVGSALEKPLAKLSSASTDQALGIAPGKLARLALETKTDPAQLEQSILADLKANPNINSPENNFFGLNTSKNDKFNILTTANKEAGETIGQMSENAGNITNTPQSFPEGGIAISELKNAASEWAKNDPTTPEAAATLEAVASKLQTLNDNGQLNFQVMQNMKSGIGGNLDNLNVKPGTAKAYSILSDNLNSALDRLHQQPGIDSAAFDQAKKTYTLTSKLLPLMVRGAAREVKAPLAGFGKILALGGGALTGNLGTGAALAGGKELLDLGAPDLLPNLGVKIFNGAKSINNPNLAVAGAQALSSNLNPQQNTPNTSPLATPPLTAKQNGPLQVKVTQPSTNPKNSDFNTQTLQGPTMGADLTQNSPSTQNEPILTAPQLSGYKQVFDRVNQGVTDPNEIKKRNTATDFLLQQRDPNYAAALAKSKNVDR